MDNFDAGQQPFPPYSPPKKAFPILPVVLGVVGLLIFLAVVGGIKAFHAVTRSSSQAIAVGNSFVDDMGHHDFQAAHALFTPQVQANTPAGNMQDIETLAEKHHGAFVTHGQPQWNIQTWNGQTRVRLDYPAQFRQSKSVISVILVQTTRGYQVFAVHYEL